MSTILKAAWATLAVGLVVVALKFGAWWVSGSVALYSDALESLVNVAAAVITLVAISISARPADASHPYGHHKAEYFSAVIEGVLIVLAALLILREAYGGWLDPQPIDAPVQGLVLSGVATAINAGWATYLVRLGRRRRSPALVADGRHLLTDVATSLGVILGFALVAATGWLVLDPVLAALVAVNILWAGYALMRGSVGALMDEAVPPEEMARIRAIVAEHAQGAIEAHEFRARHAGRMTFIEFHLVVPAAMSVHAAHAICDRLDQALRAALGEATVTIHVEPEHEALHRGIRLAR